MLSSLPPDKEYQSPTTDKEAQFVFPLLPEPKSIVKLSELVNSKWDHSVFPLGNSTFSAMYVTYSKTCGRGPPDDIGLTTDQTAAVKKCYTTLDPLRESTSHCSDRLGNTPSISPHTQHKGPSNLAPVAAPPRSIPLDILRCFRNLTPTSSFIPQDQMFNATFLIFAMDPTAAEMLGLTSVKSLPAWAGVSEDLFARRSTQIRGEPQHIRHIASIPYKAWDLAMRNLKPQTPLEGADSLSDPPTRGPSPPEWGLIHSFRRAPRSLFFLPTEEVDKTTTPDKEVPPVLPLHPDLVRTCQRYVGPQAKTNKRLDQQ
jgi:hypothetical protein